jgi:hypothetical protein
LRDRRRGDRRRACQAYTGDLDKVSSLHGGLPPVDDCQPSWRGFATAWNIPLRNSMTN